MYNWSVNTTRLKQDPEEYERWELEQMINYGLRGKKLDEKLVRKHWEYLKDRIDPYKRQVLEIFLWPENNPY